MKTFALLFLLSIACSLFAQSSEESLLLEQVSSPAPLFEADNQIAIQQIGEANQAQIYTQGNHYTEIQQSGNGNNGFIDLDGWQNQIELNQQGDQNDYELNLTGTNNHIYVEQYGIGNSVTQELSAVEDQGIRVIQIGVGHELIHTDQGSRSAELQVVQQGSPTRVIIETRNF